MFPHSMSAHGVFAHSMFAHKSLAEEVGEALATRLLDALSK